MRGKPMVTYMYRRPPNLVNLLVRGDCRRKPKTKHRANKDFLFTGTTTPTPKPKQPSILDYLKSNTQRATSSSSLPYLPECNQDTPRKSTSFSNLSTRVHKKCTNFTCQCCPILNTNGRSSLALPLANPYLASLKSIVTAWTWFTWLLAKRATNNTWDRQHQTTQANFFRLGHNGTKDVRINVFEFIKLPL